MTAPSATDGLRRSAFVVCAVVLAAFVGIGFLINAVNSGTHRPEGTAERWLSAVSDTTRNGVRADGRHRAAELGPHVPYELLLPAAGTGGKAAFNDLEVGRAVRAGDVLLVPFVLHQHADSGTGAKVAKSAQLRQQPDGRWLVVGYTSRVFGEKVPSEGGDPPSKAPLRDWVGAMLLGVLLTAGAVSFSARLLAWSRFFWPEQMLLLGYAAALLWGPGWVALFLMLFGALGRVIILGQWAIIACRRVALLVVPPTGTSSAT
jgi:hypothetical protein